MMIRPTSSQLLNAVRLELRSAIAPAVDDAVLQANLTMIDAILASVAVRCDHEVAWICEEISEIEQVASQVVAAGLPGADAVKESLGDLTANRAPTLHLEELLLDYDRAGEVLSRCLEATMTSGDVLQERAEALLDSRMARAAHIRGEFSLAGRD